MDLTSEKAALKIARRCLSYVDILEAGTPLIKAQGIRVVKELKKLGRPVFADLKTADTGYEEAKLAALQGSNYASVLASSADETIKEFVRACERYGMKSVADMIHTLSSEAFRLEKLGVDFIALHKGVDERMKANSMLQEIKELRSKLRTPLVIAGGINAESIPMLASYADILVVGSAITQAANPAKEAARIRKIYDSVFR